jgi:hypothetical protein
LPLSSLLPLRHVPKRLERHDHSPNSRRSDPSFQIPNVRYVRSEISLVSIRRSDCPIHSFVRSSAFRRGFSLLTTKGFNSTLVRFIREQESLGQFVWRKFQFHVGPIHSVVMSVDVKPSLMFQFHVGPIHSPSVGGRVSSGFCRFNSALVRFIHKMTAFPIAPSMWFQFHVGPIHSLGRSNIARIYWRSPVSPLQFGAASQRSRPQKLIDLTGQSSAHWIGRLILTFIDFY